jgi:2-polyprenyl-6-methoxyphenol hydroxylase-like FAD-dependent oxidoreductase
MPDIADVAVVGYGPVGQALALSLTRQGHRVVVVERGAALHPLPRAVGFDHETARILQSLGIADSFPGFTAPCSRYEWRNAKGHVLKAFSGLDQMGLSGWPEKLTFCQPELEKILDHGVRAGGHAQVLQGWEVVAVEQSADRAVLRARAAARHEAGSAREQASATECEVTARFVVGCDGAGSFIRRAMGSRYEELGFSADWLVVDIRPKDPQRWNADLLQICDPARPTTLVCSGPGRRRLEFMFLPGETKESMNTPAVVWALLQRWGWTPDDAVLERHAVYTFGAGIATAWRDGRLLLAGDAAHLTPPFAGQGLCAGLRDVAALAWRLHHVLTGDAAESLLESYGTERAPHARVFTEFSVMLGGVICVLDPQAAAGRDAFMLGPGKDAEDRYPDPHLMPSSVLHADDGHAGELSLQARVRQGNRVGRFDDVIGRGFVLIGLDHDPAADLDAAARGFLTRLGAHVVGIGTGCAVEDVDGAYRRWFGRLGARAALVRPDFYLFGVGEAGELTQSLAASPIWRAA